MTGSRRQKRVFSARGFTLIESLVAAGIFVIAVTAALGLFIVYTRAQRESGFRQETLNQISAEIEKIAREIRTRKIFFKTDQPVEYNPKPGSSKVLYALDDDAGISGRELELGLEDENGKLEFVYFFYDEINAEKCEVDIGPGLYKFVISNIKTGEGVCEPIFRLENAKVTDVGFFISPNYEAYPQSDSDCGECQFNGYYCVCRNTCRSGVFYNQLCLRHQPIVTMFFAIELDKNPKNVIRIQTSVSSRQYQ